MSQMEQYYAGEKMRIRDFIITYFRALAAQHGYERCDATGVSSKRLLNAGNDQRPCINQLEYDLPRWTENAKHISVYFNEDELSPSNDSGEKLVRNRVVTIKWCNESGGREMRRYALAGPPNVYNRCDATDESIMRLLNAENSEPICGGLRRINTINNTYQRPCINQLKYDLPRWTENARYIIVYEDVVAHYSPVGVKKQYLVFIVKWRNESGEMRMKQVTVVYQDAVARYNYRVRRGTNAGYIIRL